MILNITFFACAMNLEIKKENMLKKNSLLNMQKGFIESNG